MKKQAEMMMLVLMLVLGYGSIVQAGVTNPEGFETYAVTTNWIPTQAGEGWTLWGTPQYLGDGIQIQPGQSGNSTQVLQAINMKDGNNLGADWYMSIPDADAPLTTTTFDFHLIDFNELPNYGRFIFSRLPDKNASWNYSWALMVKNLYGTRSIELAVPNASGVYNKELLDGGDAWEKGTWYSMEVEEDNVNQKSRARFGPTGGTIGAWTPWLDQNPAFNYAVAGVVRSQVNGVGEFDNYYMTPEPATMVLLGAGSLVLIRRKRR